MGHVPQAAPTPKSSDGALCHVHMLESTALGAAFEACEFKDAQDENWTVIRNCPAASLPAIFLPSMGKE